MASNKRAMLPSDLPVSVALDRASGPRRAEADELLALHAEVSGAGPVVWAGRIIGFGEYEYLYESGHSGRAPELAFATGPRHHTLYLVRDFAEQWPELLDRLGKYRASTGCLYLTRLANIDRAVLRVLLERSLEETR
ncbi:MAG TPA: DUF1801 domain-containing protein [Candidatus Agrococcus pullicola]|uniref:DUF1801 domain-containing protein n=1 Tax=Candidatus Agrococcus pullicola TaxID=2838429 RepID=A0A9D1YYV7_9MICO|nr:DUF1801 domain-containing protein [Candidatus Agrococcus pullicola]